ncbi:MAG: putative Ig domain-containing protein [Pseudanabaena sp.]
MKYQYDLNGSDSNGDRILWSIDKAPTGMVIDTTTGKLRWQPTTSQIGEQAIASASAITMETTAFKNIHSKSTQSITPPSSHPPRSPKLTPLNPTAIKS